MEFSLVLGILYTVSAIFIKSIPPGKGARLMENFILKRLWLDRDKKHQDWEWLMDQANLGKTEQVDYTIAIYPYFW